MKDQFRLLRGQPYLVYCNSKSDGERFVGLFRDTWKEISLSDRRKILKYWREKMRHYRPVFVIDDTWWPLDASAQVSNTGLKMKFRQGRFRHFPDQVAKFVIAHELAHVLQWATNFPRTLEPVDPNAESDADQRAAKWGFTDKYLKLIFACKGLEFEEACELIARMINHDQFKCVRSSKRRS